MLTLGDMFVVFFICLASASVAMCTDSVLDKANQQPCHCTCEEPAR